MLIEVHGRMVVTQHGVTFIMDERNCEDFEYLHRALVKTDSFFDAYPLNEAMRPQQIVWPFKKMG